MEKDCSVIENGARFVVRLLGSTQPLAAKRGSRTVEALLFPADLRAAELCQGLEQIDRCGNPLDRLPPPNRLPPVWQHA